MLMKDKKIFILEIFQKKKIREWEKFVDRTSAMTLIFNFVGSIMFINSEVEEKMDFH